MDLGRGWFGLSLQTPQVVVVALPDKGCDIYSWTDRSTGLDVLFKSPWGLPSNLPGSWHTDSQAAWLAQYPGGWQVICPNGGAESDAPGGARWGFHGEACTLRWDVDDIGVDGETSWAVLSTRLRRAPLILQRRIALRDRTLTIDESVTNVSAESLEFMWSHHPAFGAPFLEPGCRIATGAREIVADDQAPGTLLAAASKHSWPLATAADGSDVDLSTIPAADATRSNLAYLAGFDEGWFTITNARLGLGVGVRWPAATFPYAWLWQEMHSSPGYPWWRQAYVCAIEPASSIPAQGLDAVRRKGGPLVHLSGGETRSAVIEAVLFAMPESPAGDSDRWPWTSTSRSE